MADLLQHNVLLLSPSDSKVIVATVIDREFIKEHLPEGHKEDDIAFMMATTRSSLTGKITITLDPQTFVEGEDWGKRCGENSLKGMGLDGIMTSAIWFCKKVKDCFAGLF